ncbi:MAG: carotenoid oxygenase family protein [Proteobacteria bacterium]|nr:carotenoid oxygenase family protein [Pseudomonadota bacterium]
MSEAIAGTNEPPNCHGGLEKLDQEFSYWIDEGGGTVPKDLTGTFFRNGPGRQRIGGVPFGHWFDGDGMLCAFSFKDGRVHFKNRYVRTPKYVEETAAQKILYRGFGTQIPGGITRNLFKMPANPANTNSILHGGKLLALNEGGHPWQLKPDTLETIGEHDYDGQLAKGQVFSAHGKVHPVSGDCFNFGAGISGMTLKGLQACLNLYRINPEGQMVQKSKILLDSFPFCHDFALTQKHAIYFINSIVFGGMGSVILGRKSISDQIHFDNNVPMQVVVVDLDTLTEVRRFETAPGAIIHFGNAFESGNEIVVDGMYASDFEANDTLSDVFNSTKFGGGTYMRFHLNMGTGAMTSERVSETESEFPTFNPAVIGKQHKVCYTACSVPNGADSFFNGFQSVTFEGEETLVTLPPGLYGSEPMFAPADKAAAEDDGYVLEVVYDAYTHKSELQIYRANNVADQVCSLKLKHHVPHQFHGFFTPQVFV